MTTKLRVSRSAPLSAEAKRAVAKAKAAQRERAFLANLKALGVLIPIPEYAFARVLGRKFRADYAYPAARLAIEVEGGVWSGGKHGRGSGILKDIEKGNTYAVLGWRLLRCTPDQLATPAFAATVRDALAGTP